jgi:hypothetical protein
LPQFRVRSRLKTRSGYRESFASATAPGTSTQTAGALPSLQQLRVQLPPPRRPGSPEAASQPEPLKYDAIKVMHKLVGGMTKEGKKSLAKVSRIAARHSGHELTMPKAPCAPCTQNILRDALQIIQAHITAGTVVDVK